jgi:hypothetical protein
MKSLAMILGSSGVGKGTRVNQLIKFLETLYAPEEYTVSYNNKTFQLGLLFKELDILIIGKYNHNKKANHTSWSSMDGMWSKFGGTEPTVAYLKTLPFNILAEGYANMDTFRVRPAHMTQSLIPSENCTNFFYQVYSYGKENVQEYIARIVGRSGQPPKGMTAFEKEGSVIKWVGKIEADYNALGCNGFVEGLPHDADLDSVGYSYLKFLGLGQEMSEDFQKYTVISPHLKKFTAPEASEDW